MTARVALTTCGQLPDGDEDAELLVAALHRAGACPSWQRWDDPSVDWHAFDCALIRSTWDYTLRRDEFVAWARSVPRLVNNATVIEWNSAKTYLADLAAAGLPVVSSAFLPPGQEQLPFTGDIVIKPAVGAGSRGAGRFLLPDQRAAASSHVTRLHADGLTVLIQPYCTDIDTQGETAIIWLGGRPSHVVRKAALLPPGSAHQLQQPSAAIAHSLFVAENISASQASSAQLAVARAATAYVQESFGPVAYARVDLLPTSAGPVVTELELIEPSLFLGFAPDPDAAADLLVHQLLGLDVG